MTDNAREPYADAVARLRGHFGQPASIIFSRAQFSRRQQHPGESATQYVASLREMASRCEFPSDQLGDRVRDQFVAWCACDKIRERLLQEPGDRTLDAMVQLALSMEREHRRRLLPCRPPQSRWSTLSTAVNPAGSTVRRRSRRTIQCAVGIVILIDIKRERPSVQLVINVVWRVEGLVTSLGAVGRTNR